MGADGVVDTATIAISGTTDAKYRQRIVQTLTRTNFGVAHYNGCAAPWRVRYILSHSD